MKRLHIIGNKNNGKTTLMIQLLEHLTSMGLTVGTIKSTSHTHNLDTEGKDSWRHRQAGGLPSSIITPGMAGIFIPPPEDESIYDWLAPWYRHCDLVLVEGGRDAAGMKVEVWEESGGLAPIAGQREDVLALITDDHTELSIPCWPRRDLDGMVRRILELMQVEPFNNGLFE